MTVRRSVSRVAAVWKYMPMPATTPTNTAGTTIRRSRLTGLRT